MDCGGGEPKVQESRDWVSWENPLQLREAQLAAALYRRRAARRKEPEPTGWFDGIGRYHGRGRRFTSQRTGTTTTLTFATPKNTLVVPVGPAGSGKSTLLNQVAAAAGDAGWRYGNDDVRESLGLYVYTKEVYSAVARAALDMARARLVAGLGCALDCTHNGVEARSDALALARSSGTPCVALLSQVPLAAVLDRNATRTGARRVPDAVIQQMYTNLADINRETLLEEGFEHVHTFDETVEHLVIEFY